MVFPNLQHWTRDSADVQRENLKRESSPCSFFWSQAKSLCLAAEFFNDDRLAAEVYRGTAQKHRHKLQLALFGQLMAAFEYMLKDYLAKTIDATGVLDDRIKALDWLDLKVERVLAQRSVQSSIGSLLIHPTLGWQAATDINKRFQAIYSVQPIESDEVDTLTTLWVIRHSVAHNAGFVTAFDAARINQPHLGQKVADIDGAFISATFGFLAGIAGRLANNCGSSVMCQWMKSQAHFGPDWVRDERTYRALAQLKACVRSRSQSLPEPTEAEYLQDWAARVA